MRRERCLTRIIATLGPASDSPEAIRRLLEAGVSAFRLNFSHGSAESHAATIARIREVEAATGIMVAILADLPGPKVRVESLAAPVELRRGTVHHFAGGVPSHARLLDGPVEDFNVIYRAERVQIETDVVRGETWTMAATPLRLFLLVLAGTCELNGQRIGAGCAWTGSAASLSALDARQGEAILVRAHALDATMRP